MGEDYPAYNKIRETIHNKFTVNYCRIDQLSSSKWKEKLNPKA